MAVKVTGRELLRKKLAKLPQGVRKTLQAELTASANELADKMRSFVPVKSGALRDSIRVEPFTKGGIGAIVKAGGPTTTKPVRNGQSATYDYAMGIELGTQEMLASPFFFPAYRQSRTKIRRRASKAVIAAVQDVNK